MKKVFLNYLVIAALAGAAAFTSCEKDGGAEVVKLLETYTWGVGDYMKFEYDNQNRITKVLYYDEGEVYSTETFTYNGNDLVKSVRTFAGESDIRTYDLVKSGNGNTITMTYKWNDYKYESPMTITLNSDGLPAKIENSGKDMSWVASYQYQGNNFTKISGKEIYQGEESEYVSEYKYDNNKSPLYHCKTPKWYLIWWFGGELCVHNNMIEETWEGGKTVYTYVFDADGYPTKMTVKTEWYDEDEEDSAWGCTFTYLNGNAIRLNI